MIVAVEMTVTQPADVANERPGLRVIVVYDLLLGIDRCHEPLGDWPSDL